MLLHNEKCSELSRFDREIKLHTKQKPTGSPFMHFYINQNVNYLYLPYDKLQQYIRKLFAPPLR